MSVKFRQTRTGEWVAFGPSTEVHIGTVCVAKKDGSVKSVNVGRIGRPFQADGRECVYGYIIAGATVTHINTRRAEMCEECGERRATRTTTDLSGLSGRVCGMCYSSGALSFG